MTSLTAIIVSYNSADALPGVAASVAASSLVSEVFVVDNASGDQSAAVARALDWGTDSIEVIESPINAGFGMANNLAIGRSSADAILLCNPDVEFQASALSELLQVLERDSSIGCVGGQLTRASGEPVSSARRFPAASSLLSRRSTEVSARAGQTVDADWICGAFMLWRGDALRVLGGFDERYFLYYEDTDLCRRAADLGYRRVTVGVNITHNQGHGERTSLALRRISEASKVKYAAEWLGPRGVVAALVSGVLEASARTVRGR